MLKRLTFHSFLFIIVTYFGVSSIVSAQDLYAEVALESRNFFEKGLQDQKRFQPSLRGLIDYQHRNNSNTFNLVLFARLDAEDSQRSHFDIREAYWTHVADNWEMKLGVSKVFWGVTESRHLVDVINQTDFVENIDSEDKLGQPMMKFSVERDWGNLDLFWLPYFRERTFAGEDGRLNALPYPVNTDVAMYESSAEQWHSDFAIRYAVSLDDVDLAVSHFSGTSRNPLFLFNGSMTEPEFSPVYRQIEQTAIELQYIYEDWFWKLETISSSGENQRYTAIVAGLEYTQVGLLDSAADLGWILEYLFDDRHHQSSFEKSAPHSFERDVFFGWRLALNNADSTEILAGVILDPKTEEALYSVEFSHRIANDLKLNAELRAFQGAEGEAFSSASELKTYQLRDEDYIQFELVKYF